MGLYFRPFEQAELDTIDQDTLPVPHEIPHLLFYLQRDPNANTICYTLNYNKYGELDAGNPVKIFWIKYAEKGERKELSYLQKKLAYGVTVLRQGKDRYEIKPVAYPHRSFFLKKDNCNQYQVFTTISNKDCTLKRVFIRILGGLPLSPKVQYIELHGIEFATGNPISERLDVL